MTAKEVYDHLLVCHYGKANGANRKDVAKELNIGERSLRRLCKEINDSSEFEKLISTSDCIYLCETKEECKQAVKTAYRYAINHIKKARAMERKVGLNGQLKLTFVDGDVSQKEIETYEETDVKLDMIEDLVKANEPKEADDGLYFPTFHEIADYLIAKGYHKEKK